MKYFKFSKLFENVMIHINEQQLEKYGKSGSRKHLQEYLFRMFPDDIKEENGELLVSESMFDAEDFVTAYLDKSQGDYSAKDCAQIALNHIGYPPINMMSVESVEKKNPRNIY